MEIVEELGETVLVGVDGEGVTDLDSCAEAWEAAADLSSSAALASAMALASSATFASAAAVSSWGLSSFGASRVDQAISFTD
ncbi:hypothetical protein WICPIJ_001630 [Wickerhamomyces pijperi]|uniref:Uncharacterized protein n=1 Tax=Wickerhamomyces pijperi TaxID=599730 RepID=A0A9P8QAI3_WICPI|nr:hypothetical protein WICPIJ_001630 [Wickerhamomyces pijperi]